MLFIVGLGLFYGISCNYIGTQVKSTVPIEKKDLKYGFDTDTHYFEDIEVKPNQYLGDILGLYGVGHRTISGLAE